MITARLETAVQALKSGDNSAFDYIYDHTYKAVFFAAYKIVGSKEAAEDILQEVYAYAYKKLGLYNGGNF